MITIRDTARARSDLIALAQKTPDPRTRQRLMEIADLIRDLQRQE